MIHEAVDRDEIMRELLASSLDTASVDDSGWHDHGAGPGSREGDYIDWLTIKEQTESVKADVKRIKEHPLVPNSIPVHGFVYHCETGRLVEV